LVFLLLALVGLRAFHLGFPDTPYFDEIYYVGGARDYLAGRADENSVHPPLAKMHLAAGMALWGDHPAAWRVASLICGTGTLLLSGALAWVLTGRSRVAALATLLLGLDFLQLVQCRVAMLDGVQSFWIAAGLLAAGFSATRPQAGLLPDVVGGLCLGCATACKWNGLFAVVGALLGMAWLGVGWRRLLRASVAYVAMVALIYGLSYVPFLLREGIRWDLIWAQHKRMWEFRYDPRQFHHRYLSPFYTWPLSLRPVWYHFVERGGQVSGIVAMGCPLFWWFGVLLVGDSLASRLRRKAPATRFLLATLLAQWLLWALATTGGFVYYMLPITPLLAILVARELDDWWEESLSRRLAIAYLVVLVLVFGVYYPLLIGWWVPRAYFQVLFFLPGWT
jgi:dolichyl-phosphate-mannose--protein O-mannosyl transferase